MEQLAIVFPGQGSQYVGMMKDYHQSYPVVGDYFSRASAVLGLDLLDVCLNGPESVLGKTEVTQPAMLVAGCALWEVVKERICSGVVVMAGHSLGEYSALVCSGAIDFEEAVALVQQRGRLMQQAVPAGKGGMAAVLGLEDARVEAVCRRLMSEKGGVVEPVNFNAPGQVVIAGDKALVDEAVERLKDAGARRALPLSVSVPAHSSLMKAAAEEFGRSLEKVEIRRPRFPVIQNVDARAHESVDEIRKNLLLQLYSPVQWTRSVNEMAERKVTLVVECGPGNVLTGLNKRISKKMKYLSLGDIENLKSL